jgi:hypothetical protein
VAEAERLKARKLSSFGLEIVEVIRKKRMIRVRTLAVDKGKERVSWIFWLLMRVERIKERARNRRGILKGVLVRRMERSRAILAEVKMRRRPVMRIRRVCLLT